MSDVNEYLTKIKKYFEEAGLDVFVLRDGMKFVFNPGSAYKNIKEEELPDKFHIKDYNADVSISKNFKKEFKISHQVDLERLIRGISIILTGFMGPQEEDLLKEHVKRLFMKYMAWDRWSAEDDMANALMYFGDFYGVRQDKIKYTDYLNVAQILNDYFRICVGPL